MKVFIDPEDDIQYMSFYIKGLFDLFGKDNVSFRFHAFDEIPIEERYTRTMRVIVKKGVIEKRYVIDTNDNYRVNDVLYNWSDVYGSVNANYAKTQECFHGKLVSLCPSFAIKYTGLGDACVQAIRGGLKTHRNKKKYLGCWKRMIQRPQLEDYYYTEPQENYVFHLSTLWQSDEWNRNDLGVNLRRSYFIRACKELRPQLLFEGGLVSYRTDSEAQQFADCLCQRYCSEDCLKQTKASAIVFNTPAYWDCHGWKLGEYMALGKAVLSTPLSNDLPSPLVHGTHFHLVEDCSIDAFEENVLFLMRNKDYRNKLEQNILKYWMKYGTPEASLKLLGITKH